MSSTVFTPERQPDSVRSWAQSARTKNVDTAISALSAQAVIQSPVTTAFEFRSPREIRALLSLAYRESEDYAVTHVSGSGNDWVVILSGVLHGQRFDEVQQLRLDSDGKIYRATLHVRPLAAVTMMARTFGPLAPRLCNRPGLEKLVRISTRLMHRMAASGDRTLISRIRDRRSGFRNHA